MTALNEKQSKELCRKIEQCILKNGYFIFDTDDWDGLHIEYKQFTHGKNYEYADYTEITVALDGYNVTDKLQVKYNFIKSIYVGRTGDSYRVYYKRENGEKDGGRPYSMNEAAEFIANRFIELVENKIMNKKFENYKEYPEVVYKNRVYRWFNNNTSTLSDAELQKFVNLCMRGNLTFQCADEIDIDDPDISMIDHLLMDIASQKNDELINTYTDEIDWDNDYLENCTTRKSLSIEQLERRVTILENKIKEGSLKSRVAKLEKKFTSDGLTDVTWNDYLDKNIVTKVRDIIDSKIGDDAYVSEVFNFHSYNDGDNKFIRLYTFEIENKAEEWDDIEEYGETWDDWGGAEAYAEDKDAKQYTLLNDHGKICVVIDRLMGSGPSNELGTYSSVEEAANAIIKSRDVY